MTKSYTGHYTMPIAPTGVAHIRRRQTGRRQRNRDATGYNGTIPWVTPATFYPCGLCVHERVGGGGWNVTHTRSGLAVRTGLTKADARRLVTKLSGMDWTFPSTAVGQAHAEAVRAVMDLTTNRVLP